jgi:hypothetical protein
MSKIFKGTALVMILGIVGALSLFLLIQLIPYGHDHTNPPVVAEPNWDSPQTRELAQRACFDCHSNESVWPWYSNIAPVSWLVQADVDEARDVMNFSDWVGGRRAREAASVVSEGEMPPGKYLIMHPNANLNASDKQALIKGLEATLGK